MRKYLVGTMLLAASLSWGQSNAPANRTMFQYFEWDLYEDGIHWTRLANDAASLKYLGIDSVWIPPPSKSIGRIWDVGYGIYDRYDLGEFDQQRTIRTKYGTKQQLLEAVSSLKDNGLLVYSDIVLNHLLGAESSETVTASPVAGDNRNYWTSGTREFTLPTVYQYPGRNGKYSTFTYNRSHFNGMTCEVAPDVWNVCLFEGSEWNWEVDSEFGNYDYLIGANLDFDNPEVVREAVTWGKWLTKELTLDGYRLDAVKHIKFEFLADWVQEMRSTSNRDLFVVGEYFSGDFGKLENFLYKTNWSMSLFDMPLHYKMQAAATSFGNFDLRTILDGTLMQVHPFHAVTFVDNHDTQVGRESGGVPDWFKPIAYSLILTRQEGYPTVFYGDYFGIVARDIDGGISYLDPLLLVRKNYAYGRQIDYFDNPDLIGWTREGTANRPGSGVAVLITDRQGGAKRMYVGSQHRGENWINVLDPSESVRIDESGHGNFVVAGGSASVWVNEQQWLNDNRDSEETTEVEFLVRHAPLAPGEVIFVTGSTPELGSFIADDALATSRMNQTTSVARIDLKQKDALEIQTFKVNTRTGEFVKWNEGINRRLRVGTDNQQQVLVYWRDEPENIDE